VAEALDDMNAKLEAELKAGKEHKAAVMAVVRQAIVETKAIRFEGNNYSEEWKAEAERRGLPHAKDTVAALHIWEKPASKAVFAKSGILSEGEQESRLHIRHEEYQKVIAIETQVLRQIAETQILPSVTADLGARAQSLGKLAEAGLSIPDSLKAALQAQVTLAGEAQARLSAMKAALADAEGIEDLHARTEAFGSKVNQAKHALREVLDALEDACDADLWPLPKYWQLLSPLV
jgi:glutamine synthetase